MILSLLTKKDTNSCILGDLCMVSKWHSSYTQLLPMKLPCWICNRAALAAPCPSGLGLVSATSSMITCRQKFSLLFSLFWTVTSRCFNLKKLISNDADQLMLIQYIVRRLPGPRPCLLFPFPVWLPCLVLRPRVHIACLY